jgi:hypothetical protein
MLRSRRGRDETGSGRDIRAAITGVFVAGQRQMRGPGRSSLLQEGERTMERPAASLSAKLPVARRLSHPLRAHAHQALHPGEPDVLGRERRRRPGTYRRCQRLMETALHSPLLARTLCVLLGGTSTVQSVLLNEPRVSFCSLCMCVWLQFFCDIYTQRFIYLDQVLAVVLLL